MQFFERPKELMTGDQQDDLLFFVVHEAYQVTSLQPQHPCLKALCVSGHVQKHARSRCQWQSETRPLACDGI